MCSYPSHLVCSSRPGQIGLKDGFSVSLENQTIKLWYFDPNALFLKTIEYLSQCLVFLFWYFDLVPRAPSGTFVCPQAHFENWKYLRRGIICHLIVSWGPKNIEKWEHFKMYPHWLYHCPTMLLGLVVQIFSDGDMFTIHKKYGRWVGTCSVRMIK